MPRYAEPSKGVRFGDLFRGDTLFDAYLKSDAVALGSHVMGDQMRDRLAAHYNRPDIREAVGALAFSGALPQKPEHDHLLAHGRHCRAVLVTDDCAIESAYGRDGAEPRGRLLFAAVRDASDADAEELAQTPSFDRFPLPAEQPHVETPGIVDLKRLFMVDVRDANPSFRFASLSDEAAEDFAVNWAAYVTRHGPLPGLKNAEKLAVLLAGGRGNNLEAAHVTAAELISEIVNMAWRLEGDALELVSEAYERNTSGTEAINAVLQVVRQIAARASEATSALEAHVARVAGRRSEAPRPRPG